MPPELSSSVSPRDAAHNNSFKENSDHLNHNVVLRNFKQCWLPVRNLVEI